MSEATDQMPPSQSETPQQPPRANTTGETTAFRKESTIIDPQGTLETLAALEKPPEKKGGLATLDLGERMVYLEPETEIDTPLRSFDFVNSEANIPSVAIMTQAVNAIKDKDYSYEGDIIKDQGGNEYRIRWAKAAKHARVYLVDSEGERLSFVIRSSSQEGRDALQVMQEYPVAASYLPLVYAISDEHKWTVMEKVTGLEAEELRTKMKEDPEFLRRYARAFAKAVRKIYQNGLQMSDVSYSGQNIMVDPQTGEFKFIEQRNLRPSDELNPGLSPDELLSEFIFENLDELYKDKQNSDIDQDFQMAKERFIFEFLRECSSEFDLQTALTRSKRYGKTSKQYRYYQPLVDPANTGNPIAEPYEKYLLNRTLNQDIIQALETGDFDRFSSLIRQGSFFEEISDESDPRYAPRIIN